MERFRKSPEHLTAIHSDLIQVSLKLTRQGLNGQITDNSVVCIC